MSGSIGPILAALAKAEAGLDDEAEGANVGANAKAVSVKRFS